MGLTFASWRWTLFVFLVISFFYFHLSLRMLPLLFTIAAAPGHMLLMMPATLWTIYWSARSNDNIKVAWTVLTYPPSSIYWELLTISHSIQHTTYNIQAPIINSSVSCTWSSQLSTAHFKHDHSLISAIAHRYYITWVTLIHRCSATAKNMKCLILSLWPIWTVGCRMLRVPYDRPVSQAKW